MSRAGQPTDASALGQPLEFAFSGRSAPNRFLKAAMSERMSSWSENDPSARGIPTSQLVETYSAWGKGHIGLILTGNVMIHPEQLEAEGNLIVPPGAPFSGERFDRFVALAAAAGAKGSLVVAQVSHPGRQVPSHIQPHPISASAVQLTSQVMGNTFAAPRTATKEDIRNVVEGFASTAEYLERAGYDGIQLHGAHGYLLSQFLSETTNIRTDEYGGSLANRMRLILEIRAAIAKRVRPGFIVGIKINSVEFQPKGFQPEEAQEVCRTLEDHQFDFVELSGGTYENFKMNDGAKRDSTKQREAFFMEFAQLIVSSLTKTKSYLTGGFRSATGMMDGLRELDGIGLARPLCQEPFLCRDILSGKVSGALIPAMDPNDFGLTAGACFVNMQQLGHRSQPVDVSSQDGLNAVIAALVKWGERKAKDRSEEAIHPPFLSEYAVPLLVES